MNNNKLIPELRFSEFNNDGNWCKIKIEDFADSYSGLSGKSGSDFGQGQPYISYKQVYNDKTIDFSECSFVNVNADENQNKIIYGDILITTSSETPEEVGYSNVVLEKPKYATYLNSFCFGIRINKENFINVPFSNYLFKTPEYRLLVTKLAQGVTRYNISKNKFLGLKLSIPSNLKEQQKIANCLSSLDEVISLHEEKLVALEEHKKGLMQNLFPQEGETVPKYRFPDFKNDGDWNPTTVDENCLLKGRIGYRGYTTADLVNKGEGALVLGGKHIKKHILNLNDPTYLSWEKYYESPEIMIETGDIIFSQRGTLGDCAIIEENIGFATINPSMVLMKNITCNAKFLYYILIGERIQNEVNKSKGKGAIPMLSQKQIKEFSFLIPESKEQKKIAQCLSSVDELITEQSNKIDQLKQHKKGLMQGLFPKVDF